jgi:hypothetical protein
MTKKFRCYLAHPYESQDTDEINIIKKELKNRRVHIINPFVDEEQDILKKYGRDNYYPNPPFKMSVEIWSKDKQQVESLVDMILVYVPDGTRLSGGCGIEMWMAHQQKKYIQIISKSKHPAFAYVMAHGKADMYDSIDAWINNRPMRWE